MEAFAYVWQEAMGRACWQGALALAVVWLMTRAWSRLPVGARVWLWRLALLKLLLAVVWVNPLVTLAVTPAAVSRSVEMLANLPGAAMRQMHPPVAAPPAARPLPPPTSAPVPAARRVRVTPGLALLVLWILGVLWGGLRFGAALRRARRLRARARPVTDAAVLEVLAAYAHRVGIRRPPALLLADCPSPLLLGGRRDAILLPEYVLQDRAALTAVLAHELLHLRRRDLNYGWFTHLVGLFFFFHPLVWVAERELRLAQEMACDAAALRLTGCAPTEYASLLVTLVQRLRTARRLEHVTVGWAESHRHLDRRLRFLVSPSPTRTRLLFAATVVALLAVGGLCPWGLAQGQFPLADRTIQTTTEADFSGLMACISGNGRVVLIYSSLSLRLASGGGPNLEGLYAYDRVTGEFDPVTSDTICGGYAMSADGRYVAFSDEVNPTASFEELRTAVFVRDRWRRTTAVASVDENDAVANDSCDLPDLSADGRFLVFCSKATNLVSGRGGHRKEVFLRDLWTGDLECVSAHARGLDRCAQCKAPSISDDGRYVAFASSPPLSGQPRLTVQTFLWDRLRPEADLIDQEECSNPGYDETEWFYFPSPVLNADGRYVTFLRHAGVLDNFGTCAVMSLDRRSGAVSRIGYANYTDEVPSTSGDGRFTAFTAPCAYEGPGWSSALVYDREAGTAVDFSSSVMRESSAHRSRPRLVPPTVVERPSISADGRYVAFSASWMGSKPVPGMKGHVRSFARTEAVGVYDRVTGKSDFIVISDWVPKKKAPNT